MTRHVSTAVPLAALVALLALYPSPALGHCDTMDGPVVKDARRALAAGDVTPVLKWVRPDAAADIAAAFERTVAVRKKGAQARDLADNYFFETLVRIHRAGEGAPYTGLKSTPVEPIIAESDNALAAGSVDGLAAILADALAEGVRERFEHVKLLAAGSDKSVDAGREYVAAYVEFTHYVERLHAAIGAAGHEPGAAPGHDD